MTKNVSKKIFYTVLILIVIAAIGCAWLSLNTSSSFRDKVFRAVPYPAALVNGRPVMASEIVNRLELSRVFYEGQIPESERILKQRIFEQLIDDEKLRQLASKHGITVSQSEVDEEYNKTAAEYQKSGSGNFDDWLKKYNLTEQEYKKKALQPQILAKNLTVWFNGQKDLNKVEYDKISAIQQKISNGSTFESLVRENTEDDSGKLTEGDLGFIDVQTALPELREALASGKSGEIKVVPSRYGIHLIKIMEIDSNGTDGSVRVHVRQIFLNGENFENWVKEQTKGYSVVRMIKL